MNKSVSGVSEYEDIMIYRGLCPHCDIGIHVDKNGDCYTKNSERILINFECPICGGVIYLEWLCIVDGDYLFSKIYPNRNRISKFNEEIKSISEDFIKIYNEAEIAENNNLYSICGPGYRKSLEFLIKDYIIVKKHNIKEEVKSKFLGYCIKNYIDDIRIKDTAERAVWIGNDETHYERKWESKDINDLKNFIQLIIYWIESELKYAKMIEEMPMGK